MVGKATYAISGRGGVSTWVPESAGKGRNNTDPPFFSINLAFRIQDIGFEISQPRVCVTPPLFLPLPSTLPHPPRPTLHIK